MKQFRKTGILKTLSISFLLLSQSVLADGISSLRDFFHNTNTMKAKFSQVVNDKKGQKIQEVAGTMQLQRPNQFRWDYNKPYEQQIVSDGKQVFLYDIELEQVTIRELSKSLGSSPAALLTGGEDVEKSFKLKNAVRKDGLTWVLAIPKNADSGYDRVLLGFNGEQLRKMELIDTLGNTTHIQFEGIERNLTFPVETFLFTPPKGADVVGE